MAALPSSSLGAIPLFFVRIPAVLSNSKHQAGIGSGNWIQQKQLGSAESAWVQREGEWRKSAGISRKVLQHVSLHEMKTREDQQSIVWPATPEHPSILLLSIGFPLYSFQISCALSSICSSKGLVVWLLQRNILSQDSFTWHKGASKEARNFHLTD